MEEVELPFKTLDCIPLILTSINALIGSCLDAYLASVGPYSCAIN